ncbi:BON domain-containing protein [Rhizobium paknamense]|uniref:Osmotically-inducible protein OsmY n=1 Tax=Rhizobium paknamense TaxID=1206817 RepID=A0ABU0IFG7_9HYPH|nr:BON domain-containing protein [Rhizobium paknamense]MDQ0456896.1 osmotically-inducible protein OsmY [Rhizobium paknamense]
MVFKPAKNHGEQPEIISENPPMAELEAAVAAKLAISHGLDASGIDVTAMEDEICLTGTVFSEGEVDRAVEVALSVPHVYKVSVDLTVISRTLH